MMKSLLLCIILLALAPISAAEGAALTFATPATAGEEVRLEGLEWFFVRVDPDHGLKLEADLGEESAFRRTTYVIAEREDPSIVAFSHPRTGVPGDWREMRPDARVSMAFDDVGLLAIQAASISTMTLDPVTLHAVDEGSSMWQGDASPDGDYFPEYDYFQQQVRAASVLAEWPQAGHVEAHVEGITQLQWIGGTATCSGGPCPESSMATDQRADGLGQARFQTVTFWELRTDSGTAQADGASQYRLAFGESLTAVVGDWIRLSQVHQVAQCPDGACDEPQGRTVTIEGETRLLDLHADGTHGLSATALSPDGVAFFDEDPVAFDALRGTVGGIAAAGVGVVGLGVLWKQLAGLFTKVGKRKTLDHPRRRILMDHIEENPGTNFREVMRRTGIPAGTLRHHLNVMVREGLIVERSHGATTRFFENHSKYEDDWSQHVLLREDTLSVLHDWVSHNPGSMQSTILAAMAEQGWSRSSTQHRLSRLIDAGLVSVSVHGRRKAYEAATPSRGASTAVPRDAAPIPA